MAAGHSPVGSGEVRQAAARLGLALGEEEYGPLAEEVGSLIGEVRRMDSIADHLPAVTHPRTSGYRPPPEEDSLHAWYWKSDIPGAAGGPLSGLTFAVKDNICVSGVPMMNGASFLEGYVPEIDASVVSRLLDAGAIFKGKATCEYLCFAGDSDTNATGPTDNPHRPGYSAGGSSSGSAALVAAGEVDFALGCDQGGSIRMPAHFCGVVGMKPTWGLVPYTGIAQTDLTLDYVGPMSRTVELNARLLDVLAFSDGLDPRQGFRPCPPPEGSYTDDLDAGVDGLRVGILDQGFGFPGSEPEVEEAVRDAAARLEKQGAVVSQVSVPMHHVGSQIWSAIVLQGGLEMMMLGNAVGTNWRGLHLDSLSRSQARWRHNPAELPGHIRTAMVAGEILRGDFGGRYYHKAQNLSRKLADDYDAILAEVDVLAMPTVPYKARPHFYVPEGHHMETSQTVNCAPFDCTGHPAISVPCAKVEGLPVGIMLVGRRYAERLLYRVASAVEDTSPDMTPTGAEVRP